jgi:hypothetical protein
MMYYPSIERKSMKFYYCAPELEGLRWCVWHLNLMLLVELWLLIVIIFLFASYIGMANAMPHLPSLTYHNHPCFQQHFSCHMWIVMYVRSLCELMGTGTLPVVPKCVDHNLSHWARYQTIAGKETTHALQPSWAQPPHKSSSSQARKSEQPTLVASHCSTRVACQFQALLPTSSPCDLWAHAIV